MTARGGIYGGLHGDGKSVDKPREPRPMTCWGDGCEARIPDDTEAVMRAHGWGFMQARDDFASGGIGSYFACPVHKSPNS